MKDTMTDSTVTESIEEPLPLDGLEDATPPPPDAPPYRTLLEVWRATLEPATKVLSEPINPQWATRVVTTYPQIQFAQVRQVSDLMSKLITELRELLDGIIDGDENALTYTSAEEDATENAVNYKTLLVEWQAQLLRWELAWTPEDEQAATTLAAMSEVHNMFFSQTGLVAHLEEINFQYDEADQQSLHDELTSIRDSYLEASKNE